MIFSLLNYQKLYLQSVKTPRNVVHAASTILKKKHEHLMNRIVNVLNVEYGI